MLIVSLKVFLVDAKAQSFLLSYPFYKFQKNKIPNSKNSNSKLRRDVTLSEAEGQINTRCHPERSRRTPNQSRRKLIFYLETDS